MEHLLFTGRERFIDNHTSPEALQRVLELPGLPAAPHHHRRLRSEADLERAFEAAAQPIEAMVHAPSSRQWVCPCGIPCANGI